MHTTLFDDRPYGASPTEWVRNQVAEYESSNGTAGNTLRDSGLPVIIMTTIGHRSGLVRKVPLMRVEHQGVYAIVASRGGAATHPGWYYNLVAEPRVAIQDGPAPFTATVRQIDGDERSQWWTRCVEAFAPYDEYRKNTERTIPVFLAEPLTA